MNPPAAADFSAHAAACQARIERILDGWLPSPATEPTRLHDALRYSVLGSGKRLRPILVYTTGTVLGVDFAALDGPAAAVELIHAYSLVHDDLPAMDDDDLRRGRPTCHRAFDEATAILVGDALQVLAFKILASDKSMGVDAEARTRMIDVLADASGTAGMAGGQAIDLAAVGRKLTIAELEAMHKLKTGALIEASVRLAVLAASSLDARRSAALGQFAAHVGLAFQIQDDILDVEGDPSVLGKAIGADSARDKPTYPSIVGMAAAKQRAQELCRAAIDDLAAFDSAADPLRELARFVVERSN
ncbi:MAG TPA: farnesyl diphosphate synthase [Steroidobacteraceae bacterium]|nr:farnesyl diphosphate synthase [Steroidobacteraceae bacterium]